jgi:hypothetical protein
MSGGSNLFESGIGGGKLFINRSKNKNGSQLLNFESPNDSKRNSDQCSTGSDKQNPPLTKPIGISAFAPKTK